nr:EOG090X0H59 [Leptodora kindtii]
MSSTNSARDSSLKLDAGGYDSSYESDGEQVKLKKRRKDLAVNVVPKAQVLAHKSFFVEQYDQEERRRTQSQLRGLTAYDRHKMLMNEYFFSIPGSANLLQRDRSKDRRDIDIIRENHKFLWEESDTVDTWGKQIARKYYDKLFKEYCVADLSRYKENKVGIRWRIEKEVVVGKGQFSCGAQKCDIKEHLRTWEVNFAYVEQGEKKNALVKIRLCPDCSYKLNYHHKKKEVKRKKSKKVKKAKKPRRERGENPHSGDAEESEEADEPERVGERSEKKNEQEASSSTDIWRESQPAIEDKSRDEEFEEYLQDLFM